jgi:hypothetical protein
VPLEPGMVILDHVGVVQPLQRAHLAQHAHKPGALLAALPQSPATHPSTQGIRETRNVDSADQTQAHRQRQRQTSR